MIPGVRTLRALTTLLATIMLGQAAFAAFADAEHSWHAPAIAALRDLGVIQGYPDGTFRPAQTLTRAELLKIVMTPIGEHPDVEQPCFSDIVADEWYARFVCAGMRLGVVGGYPDGTFRPEQSVNEAEALKISLRAYDIVVEEQKGQHWYAPYVREAHERGIASRYAYDPAAPLTRERMAGLLHRILEVRDDPAAARGGRNLSPACGQLEQHGEITTVQVDGQQQPVSLRVPPGGTPRTSRDLIIAFHGRTNSAAQVRKYYELDEADSDAIIAYPTALENGNGTYTWTSPGENGEDFWGLRLFDALVDDIGKRYCIDENRIFVVGHSLGGWMANATACRRGDVVRASAVVGSSPFYGRCTGPVAGMFIHHPEDALAPVAGAEQERDKRRQSNRCNDTWQDTSPSSLSCRQAQGCLQGNPLLWCPHENGNDHRGVEYTHNWPRQTSRHIVQFFQGLDR